MAIIGLRDTNGFVTDQRPKNWREGIMLLYPNGKAPLTALTALMKDKSTDDPEFNWWEKSLSTQRMQLSGSITNVQTSLPVVSGAKMVGNHHVLRVEHTEELILVTADPSVDTSLPTVVRGFGGTSATAVTLGVGVNPYVHVVGTAFEEGSAAPSGINYDPTKRNNYCQIFRNTLEITRTASKTRLRTGDAVKEAKRECLELQTIEMEKAFLFGKKYEGTLSGKPHRMTGGIIQTMLPGNTKTPASNQLTMSLLETYMKDMFAYGSSEKMAFGGNLAILAIQQAIRKNSTYQFMQGQKEFGMNVSRLISPFGELVIKSHPLFNQVNSDVTNNYYALDSWLVVVDQAELVYRYVDDQQYQKDLQTNGLDSMKSGYLAECGLEIHFPEAHYLLKGLGSGVSG